MSVIEKGWSKFAKRLRAKTKLVKETQFNPENTFTIEGQNAIVELIWCYEPEKGRGPFVKNQSTFKFRLRPNLDIVFKIYPKDVPTELFTLFSSKKVQTGNSELDKSYIIICSHPHCIEKMTPDLIHLKQSNKFPDFVVTTESEGESFFLIIQINNVIVEQEDLMYFYEFGRMISGKLNECE